MKTRRLLNIAAVAGLGLCALATSVDADARSRRKPKPTKEEPVQADLEQLLRQTEDALQVYDITAAEEHLNALENHKNNKAFSTQIAQLRSRTVQLTNMLERVERIEILDSISVDSAAFFSVYKLANAAGRLIPGDAVSRLGSGTDESDIAVGYMPENGSEILWSAVDATGLSRIFGANILDDGTMDSAAELDPKLGSGANTAYPFLMPDGVTLYYASDQEGGLGGYDIYMSRRKEDGTGFYQGQNLGMPYNSPDNDYMMAIDEATGLGWWATDRNHEPGKVTVYVFAPSQMRVNVELNDPNLTSLARVSDISLTRKPDVNYTQLLESKLPKNNKAEDVTTDAMPSFAIDMGNGKVYYSLGDFTNPRAREAMLDMLATQASLRRHLVKEDIMRQRYRAGDSSLASRIHASESETEQLRARIASQRNAAVRLETIK